MKVLVDTSVWSLALRRRSRGGEDAAAELSALVEDGRVAMIGPIRREILSGIRERPQFDKLRERLHPFPDLELSTADYEDAAEFFHRCRAKGIQGSNTDFLICAVAARRQLPIFTTDGDFSNFAKVIPIALHGTTV